MGIREILVISLGRFGRGDGEDQGRDEIVVGDDERNFEKKNE
jgi:hypothetical protein